MRPESIRHFPGIILLPIIFFPIFFCFPVHADDLRYFEFAIRHTDSSQNFIAATSDSTLISYLEGQLALPEKDRNLHIDGSIAEGNDGYNKCWSWHFIVGKWQLVQISIELCDGISSDVEANPDYWINTVKSFCPWSSYVLKEITSDLIVKGDVDNDKTVDLRDVIISLKITAGENVPCLFIPADVNGDNKIGLEETVYDLQLIAGVRH